MNEVKPMPIEANIEIADAYAEFVEKVILVADKYGLDRNRVIKIAMLTGTTTASATDFTNFGIKEKNDE